MRRLVVALLCAAALCLSSCGIPTASSPSKLPRTALPRVLEQNASSSPACSASDTRLQPVYIYLVQAISGDLVQVARCVTRPATVQKVLDVLEAGPLSAEYHDDYESALNIDSNLQAVGPITPCSKTKTAPLCALATVRLDRYFDQLHGEDPIEELGQIVWSLTRSGLGITDVRFLSPKGLPVAVEIATGRFVNRPVTEQDYRALVG